MEIDGGMDECSGIVSLIQRLVCCWERHVAISEDGQQLARLLNRREEGSNAVGMTVNGTVVAWLSQHAEQKYSAYESEWLF